MTGPIELAPPLIPTMVTLSNTADEKTTRVIYATETFGTNDGRTGPRRTTRVAVDEFAKVFGEGTGLRSVRIEAVSTGFWPLNDYSLSGTPLTKGIEQKLPWIAEANAKGRASQIDGEPGKFRVNVPYFVRQY